MDIVYKDRAQISTIEAEEKVIASYYKGMFGNAVSINHDGFSISKIESEKLNIIGIYRSQDGYVTKLISELQDLVDTEKTTVIGGDINICALKNPNNYVTTSYT